MHSTPGMLALVELDNALSDSQEGREEQTRIGSFRGKEKTEFIAQRVLEDLQRRRVVDSRGTDQRWRMQERRMTFVDSRSLSPLREKREAVMLLELKDRQSIRRAGKSIAERDDCSRTTCRIS